MVIIYTLQKNVKKYLDQILMILYNYFYKFMISQKNKLEPLELTIIKFILSKNHFSLLAKNKCIYGHF